jgi:alpha-tubulin suppressor-like RCC1 family protein
VSANSFYTLAIKADGSLWGWERTARSAQDPANSGTREPQPHRHLSRVAAGSTHGLGLKADGTLWAWGSCDHGQLGNGCDGGVLGPVLVGGDFASMSAGDQYSLGIKRDATLWAWGSNQDGRLGIGLDGGIFPMPVLVR